MKKKLVRRLGFVEVWVEKIGKNVSWLILFLVIIAAYNAVARYLGKYFSYQLSSNALLEIQWYLFSIVFLLGASYTLKKNKHIRVDVFYESFSEERKRKLNFWGNLFLLLPFCITGIVVCIPSVWDSWAILESSPDPDGLARYPIKTVALLGFVLLFLQALVKIYRGYTLLYKTKSVEEAGE